MVATCYRDGSCRAISLRKLIRSNSPSRCSSGKPYSVTRPFGRTLLTRYVRSSRVRPGIISARNVTCISGLAQTLLIADPSCWCFFFLKIGIAVLRIYLLLVFCFSKGRPGAVLGLILTKLLSRWGRWLPDRIENRSLVDPPLLPTHGTRL